MRKVVGSNDRLQSRGLSGHLTDGSVPINDVIVEVIMKFLLAMTEAKTPIQGCFTRNVVRTIFMLSPGYATLPEPLHFIYTMVPCL